MEHFRAGGRDDDEYLAVYVDFHGADEQWAVSVGRSEQGGTVGERDCWGERVGGEVDLVAYYQIVVAFDRSSYRSARDFWKIMSGMCIP